jgi:hypothetical protein
MKQTKESYHQGRSIVLATVMIIIFVRHQELMQTTAAQLIPSQLPLIFISNIFGMNASELNGAFFTLRAEFTIMCKRLPFVMLELELIGTYKSLQPLALFSYLLF